MIGSWSIVEQQPLLLFATVVVGRASVLPPCTGTAAARSRNGKTNPLGIHKRKNKVFLMMGSDGAGRVV